MNQEAAIRELNTLPPEAQKEALDFIESLIQRYKQSTARQKMKETTSLTEEAFIGMWSDRPEMQDSVQWVRSIRKKEWRTGE